MMHHQMMTTITSYMHVVCTCTYGAAAQIIVVIYEHEYSMQYYADDDGESCARGWTTGATYCDSFSTARPGDVGTIAAAIVRTHSMGKKF
jgi:hypothetical protein